MRVRRSRPGLFGKSGLVASSSHDVVHFLQPGGDVDLLRADREPAAAADAGGGVLRSGRGFAPDALYVPASLSHWSWNSAEPTPPTALKPSTRIVRSESFPANFGGGSLFGQSVFRRSTVAPPVTPDQYKRNVAEFFDQRIGRRDYNRNDFHAKFASRLLEIAPPQPGDRVLDIATGTGLVAIPAARLVGERGKVVGIDISPGMLSQAKAVAESEGLRNVEFILTDAETVDFPEASFDLVLCSSALPYITDIPKALRLWHGFLDHGGRVAFNCWSASSFVTGSIIKEVAARHGIRLPYAEVIDSPEACEAVLIQAGFENPVVTVDANGRFLPLEEVESGWAGTLNHPMSHPLLETGSDALEGVRADFLAEAQKRATERGGLGRDGGLLRERQQTLADIHPRKFAPLGPTERHSPPRETRRCRQPNAMPPASST